MAEWSNELILEFVQLYEKYPILWNPKHTSHKNRTCLNDAWLNISKELSVEIPVTGLKKKKESLMATYRTLRKKVTDSQTTGSGSDPYVPSWFAYHAIDKFIRVTGNKIASLNSEDDANEYRVESKLFPPNEADEWWFEPEEPDEESTQLQNTQKDTNEDVQQEKTVFPFAQNVVRKRKRIVPVDAQVTKRLKHATDVLRSLTNNTQMLQQHTPQVTQDGAALYGQLLATKLRTLSDRNRLILQNKIDNLVFEAELKEIDKMSEIRAQATSPPFSCSRGNISPAPSQPSSGFSYASQPPSPCYTQQPPSPCYTQQPSSNAVHIVEKLNAQHHKPSVILDYYPRPKVVLNDYESRK